METRKEATLAAEAVDMSPEAVAAREEMLFEFIRLVAKLVERTHANCKLARHTRRGRWYWLQFVNGEVTGAKPYRKGQGGLTPCDAKLGRWAAARLDQFEIKG